MALLVISCRDYVDEEFCSVAIGAESLEEALEAAVEHAYASHGLEDTPSLRQTIREAIRENVALA